MLDVLGMTKGLSDRPLETFGQGFPIALDLRSDTLHTEFTLTR